MKTRLFYCLPVSQTIGREIGENTATKGLYKLYLSLTQEESEIPILRGHGQQCGECGVRGW